MARQWDAAEYAWQADRPPRCRPAALALGLDLLLRPASWSPELIPIRVMAIQDLDSDEARADPNVYDKVTAPDPGGSGNVILYGPDGSPLTRRRSDPWPWIHFQVLDDRGEPYGATRSCREARLEGSAGWLPLDHERYERPRWEGGRLVLPR
jgi:hypothetical protein